MAAVWLSSALTAYADIFPSDAPKPTVEQLQATLTGARCLVAIDDGDIVGIVQAEAGWLKHLYVAPSHWKRGIGAALHDAAVDALRADGSTRASLWVLQQNDLARTMYERRGWRLVDRINHVYPPAGIYDVGYDLVL
jgi:GNAT superfamily N-acetyltransferase